MNPPRALVLAHGGIAPTIGEDVFLAPGSTVVGDVVIGPRASVWFGCVIRGDVHRIRIGAETNIQDGSVLHVTGGTHPLEIGEGVTVGHRVILHGCTIGVGAMIGMGSIVMDGAVVGEGSLVGAGSLVPPGARIAAGMLVLGSPARAVRTLTEKEIADLTESAAHYVAYAARYREESDDDPDRGAAAPPSAP